MVQIKKHKYAIEEFRLFIGADKIEYMDFGKTKKYIIFKNKRCFEITVQGSNFEGGYANFKEIL